MREEWHTIQYDIKSQFPEAKLVWNKTLDHVYSAERDGKLYLIIDAKNFFQFLQLAETQLKHRDNLPPLEEEKFIGIIEFNDEMSRQQYLEENYFGKVPKIIAFDINLADEKNSAD